MAYRNTGSEKYMSAIGGYLKRVKGAAGDTYRAYQKIETQRNRVMDAQSANRPRHRHARERAIDTKTDQPTTKAGKKRFG